MILASSRSWGMKTTETMPARAAWAATELARLPVEAQAATLKPSWRALVRATETTRSLKEPVGLAVSFLIQSSPEAELGGQAVGPDQRGAAGAQVDGGGVDHGEERGVAPDGLGARLDLGPGDGGPEGLVVVDDLEGPEAVVADVQGFGGVGARAFPTAQPSDEVHRDPPHRSGIGTWRPRSWRGLAGCRGVTGPVPQPLLMVPPWWTIPGPRVNEAPGRAARRPGRRGGRGSAMIGW